ncbi:gliding motility lipoprotein GldH [Xylanibacter muris]|nr:gliding motility lipoprotein GldH [Xylanibacter muris]
MMVITVAAALMSCNRNTVYDHYEHTPLKGWERMDTLMFGIGPMASAARYNQEIGIRISGEYPFMSVSLIVEQHVFPAGTVRCDTVDCHFIGNDGMIKGRGVGSFQYMFPFAVSDLNEGDSIAVYIRHNMKRETLPGISDVGLRVSRQ